MLARFFIDRPIFAAVISIVITLAGAIALFQLPIAQYPPIAPPTVQVDCHYPGASAEVVAQTVAAPIEQQVNGVEGMMYMSSQSTNDGSYALTITFEPGTDLNLAQVVVQNRVSLAMPQLPDVVRQTGVVTRKRSPDILQVISITSPGERYDQLYLSNYTLMRLREEMARLPGVAEVRIFGDRDYSMRIWLDPERMAERSVTVGDVMGAIREQNFQFAAGQIGQPPVLDKSMIQLPLAVQGRLKTPEEFGEIIVRVGEQGRLLRLKDVARIEMGPRNQDVQNRFDGKPTVGLAIFQLPSANALATADRVRAKMQELAADFPDGVAYDIAYDTTPFIRESIVEVFKTLRDAIILVAIVVLVFLKGWRPAIIPLIAVPVAIIGTFAAMYVADFSVNNLTLFGLVLAIGIVVDDAIVVVEAVQHHIEKGMHPRNAAIAAMKEVSSAVIAVGLVLSAVFVPCAFVPGIVGQFFRQFALTIAISTIISTLNSLTLSPALAAILLKPVGAKRDVLTWLIDMLLGWFFNLFDWLFGWLGRGYVFSIGKLLRVPALVLAVYGGLLVLTYWGFLQLPSGFIPTQDKGYFIASIQLPDAAAAQRTRDTMARIEQMLLKVDGVKHINAIAGNSFVLGAYGSNFGSYFLDLESFEDRRTPELQGNVILANVRKVLANEVPEAIVNVFPPPAVSGLGRAGGWRLMIQDRSEAGLKLLQTVTDNVVQASAEQQGISGPNTVFNINAPKLYVDIDRVACQTQGVALGDVFQTMQGFLGSRYVNDFNRFGRTWQVVVQADIPYRNSQDDLKRLKVRSATGQMVPLGSIATIEHIGGPLVLTRYNMYPAAAINGNLAPGVSTGQGIAIMEQVAARELPKAMGYEWTELAYLERQSSNTGMAVFGWSVVFVFLVLAALYESWSLPLAVILVVPMCVLSAIAGVWQQNGDINIFTQIGFVVLIGLACKNAILIVEFARARREAGADVKTATLEACELRLRPILMTSFAFILGVVPLVFASGAGAEMRQALGIAVFSGMLGVTAFGVFLTPVFYYVIDWVHELPVFHNPLLQRLLEVSRQLVSLGFLRRPIARLLRGKPRSASTETAPAETPSAQPPSAQPPSIAAVQSAAPAAEAAIAATNGKHSGPPAAPVDGTDAVAADGAPQTPLAP